MKRDHATVNRSPINTSPSKHLVSFTKASRFPAQIKSSVQGFYTLKGSFGEQDRSMGYGKKLQFGRPVNGPSPGSYTSRSEFEDNARQTRGYSFGTTSKKYRLADEDISRRQPGPDHYNATISMKYPNVSYTLGTRTKPGKTGFTNYTGPGQYESMDLSPVGQYSYSKFLNSGCPKFPRTARFKSRDSATPGPGQYLNEHSSDINKTGYYFNSKYPTNPVRSFSRLNRPIMVRRGVSPGPGSYELFSDFASRDKPSLSER